MKVGMVKNVFVEVDSSILMEFVEHVIQILTMMVKIVCVITAFMEMLINARNAMSHAENVQGQNIINA